MLTNETANDENSSTIPSGILKTAASKGLLAVSLILIVIGVNADPVHQISPKDFDSKVKPTLEAKCIACHGPNQQSGNLRLDKTISKSQAQRLMEAISYKGTLKMPPSKKLPADDIATLTNWAKAGGAWPEPVKDSAETKEADAFFEAKIRPALIAKCVSCHGPNQQLGNLRLDKAITKTQAQKVAEAISYKHALKMPPGKKLPVDELSAMTTWANSGAPWPTAKTVEKPKGKFWAFVPPVMPALPEVKAKWWASNPLDRFVLAKLEEKGLKPAPAADRRTIIRRATFDLTGLPPTPQEIDAFIADKQPNAFERVIDRLLASPAYGERWGRHWLDVARYADSNGLDENLVYLNAWRYRDYVINAINADKPINRFIQEQVAGDLIPDAGNEGVLATGYLSLGAKMLAEDDPVKQELDIVDEQVDTLSKTFLGLTVGCARCHDHKFDPISAKDYYAMAGIFKSTKTMKNFRVVAEWNERPLGSKAEREKLSTINQQIETKTAEVNKKREAGSKAFLAEVTPQFSVYEKAARRLVESQKSTELLKPAVATPDGAIPADAVVQEAEDYKTGNLIKDKEGFGKGIGVVLNRGEYPNRVEYEISVPAAGPYQLDIRYASAEQRSVDLYINGNFLSGEIARTITGGFKPEDQKWIAQGVYMLKAGVNTIKFERKSYFPHIDKFIFVPRPGAVLAETLQSIASEGKLVPYLVRDLAQKIKNGAEVRFQLPESPDYLFPAPVAKELEGLDNEIAALRKEKPDLPLAMAVDEGKPTNLKVHLRGSYLTLGEECARRFPAVISDPKAPVLPANASGRLELANWMTDGKNPLTARVFVNRVWRWRFGRGLVGSVDNFGLLGDLPSHPELLDWLAMTFVKEDNWSLKKLHKRLMLTNTYIMSGKYDKVAGELDPDNHYLWRFPRQRLEAEEIRDSILSVAGILDRKMGGSLINLKPRDYVTNDQSANPINYDSPRRAVYLPVIRAAVYDVYTAFDFGDPTVMNGDRASTTIAPQALFMLNGSIVLSATKAQASAIVKLEGVDDSERVRKLYLTCFGRPATQAEVTRALDFLSRFEAAYSRVPNTDKATWRLNAWQSLCKSLIASNEFIYVE